MAVPELLRPQYLVDSASYRVRAGPKRKGLASTVAHALNRGWIPPFPHTVDILPYAREAGIDTKRNTVHRSMIAKYAMQETHTIVLIQRIDCQARARALLLWRSCEAQHTSLGLWKQLWSAPILLFNPEASCKFSVHSINHSRALTVVTSNISPMNFTTSLCYGEWIRQMLQSLAMVSAWFSMS